MFCLPGGRGGEEMTGKVCGWGDSTGFEDFEKQASFGKLFKAKGRAGGSLSCGGGPLAAAQRGPIMCSRERCSHVFRT